MRIVHSLFLSLVFALPAFAHVGVPEGRVPFVQNGQLTGGGSTWGIVVEEVVGDERQITRVCEEAIGQPPTFFHQRQDGVILIGTQNGMLTSPDNGCTLNPSDTILEGRYLTALARPQNAPETLYVITSTETGDNGFFKSTDEGTTFVGSSLSFSPLSFRTVVTNENGEHVFVSAYDNNTQTPSLFVSHDFGETFAEVTPGFAPETQFIILLNVDDRQERVALVPYDGGFTSTLHFLDYNATTLSADEEFDGVISDYLATKLYEYVIVGRQNHFRRPVGGTFAPEVGPVRCLRRVPGDNKHIWGCGLPFNSGHFLKSLDGVNFKPRLNFLSVVETQCPIGTTAREPCAYLFDDDDDNDITPFIVPEEDEKNVVPGRSPRCSSSALPKSNALASLLFALVLGTLMRRRRKS